MKRNLFVSLAAAALVMLTPSCATASSSTSGSGSGFDLKDILNGSGSAASTTGSVISNLLEGVFSTSNLEIKDLAGVWTSQGSAVNFKSENLLKQAGGTAAAGAIESKLNPYFKQYGLTGAVLTVQVDGTFTLAVKKMTLSGTITKGSDGNFVFNFQALGGLASLGKMKTYVTKSANSMDVMFDAQKLMSILQYVAKFSGSSLATTAVDLLGSYDGMYVGFKMKKTGTVEGEGGSGVGEAAKNALKDILGK